MLDKIDYQLEPEARCPYCGEHIQDSRELADEDETECDECGGIFITRRVIDVSYSSTPETAPNKPLDSDHKSGV